MAGVAVTEGATEGDELPEGVGGVAPTGSPDAAGVQAGVWVPEAEGGLGRQGSGATGGEGGVLQFGGVGRGRGDSCSGSIQQAVEDLEAADGEGSLSGERTVVRRPDSVSGAQ